ncbi:unannotated protein [freshwater metagenome]|uniref:Unannotated protein n=1 Tax=freshwater metagenome TaxID=449393 RepID=A0A6J6NAD3_9ZZZZ
MLALIVANRYAIGVIQENVGCHERWISEQARRNKLGLIALVFELCHSPEFSERRSAFHEPRKLGVFADVALNKEGGASRVDTDGQKKLGQFEGPSPEFCGILGDGKGVEINHAEDGVCLVLVGDPVAQGTQEVAELDRTGGLDAREDTRHGRRC